MPDPLCMPVWRPRYAPNAAAIGKRFPAVHPQAVLDWFEVFKDDEFIVLGENRYRCTTSCSTADYLIPDYMMERIN